MSLEKNEIRLLQCKGLYLTSLSVNAILAVLGPLVNYLLFTV